MVGMRSVGALVAVALVTSAASAATPAGQAGGYIVIQRDGGPPVQIPLGTGATHAAVEALMALNEAGLPPNPFVPSPVRQKVTFLGVASSPVFETLGEQLRLPRGTGLVVDYVRPDSPATKAGIKPHDILLRLDDQILVNPPQLAVLVRLHKPGDKVAVTLLREGKEEKVAAELGETEMVVAESPEFMPGQPFRPGRDALWPWRMRPEHLTDEIFVPDPLSGGAGAFAGYASSFSDNEHDLALTVRNGAKYLVAKDKAGKVVFEGPVQTDEQRKGVPPEILKKLAKMEETTKAGAKGELNVNDGVLNLTVSTDGGNRRLLAKDVKSGKVLFDGPINTPQELNAVPKDIREKLKAMNPIIIPNPAPTTAPESGRSPM